MTDRFPLIANPTTKQIEELASGDNLNLQNSGIVGATTITANKFVGSLEGNATSADTLNNAANITAGTISSSRLSGFYGIDVNSANTLTDAANITSGFISSERLNGRTYDINIEGTALIATALTDASRIITGIIEPERLSGTYNINAATADIASNLTPGLYAVDISGNAATATTATNLSGGNITGTNLNISGISTLASSGGITTTGGDLYVGGDLYANDGDITVSRAIIGFSTITNASIGVATVGFLTATNVRVSGTSTVGFLTASNISTPNARIGILTATTLSNISNAGISSLTADYIRGIEITSIGRINTGIASVGIATIGVASITNAYIGVATVGQININSGIITATFSGNLSGTATTATNLADAANITTGIVSTARLSGTYNISITGDAQASTATTAVNVIGGIASVTQLNVSGVSTLGTVRISSGIITASSGVVTYYGDGSGLTNIQVSSTTDSYLFNTGISSSFSTTLLGIGSTIFTFPATAGKEYIVLSINCSNVSTGNTEVNVIGAFDFNGGQRSYFAYNVPIPTGTAVEIMKQPQVLNPSDRIVMRSTNFNRIGTNNIIEAYVSYQEKTSTSYFGVGLGTVGLGLTDPIGIYTATTYPSVIQSIRLTNVTDSGGYPVSVQITNGLTTTRLVDNLIVPKYASVELLDAPKRIETNSIIQLQLDQAFTINAQVSGSQITS